MRIYPCGSLRKNIVTEYTRYQLLRLLEANPDINQRQLAEAAGVSVGKVNYVLRGLTDKGLVKAENFRRSKNKLGYLYKLTPAGIREKVRITRRYLAQREADYNAIREEITALQAELDETEERGREPRT